MPLRVVELIILALVQYAILKRLERCMFFLLIRSARQNAVRFVQMLLSTRAIYPIMRLELRQSLDNTDAF